MIRRTSIETYNQIKENGLLSKMRWVTYNLLYQFGPCTASELMAFAREEHPNWSHEHIETIGRRLSELKERGVAVEIDQRPSKTTGKPAYVWQTTDKKPIKLEKKKRVGCPHCKGRGYVETQQGRLF